MQTLFPFADYWWFYAGFTVFVLLVLALSLIPLRGLATTVVAPDFDSLVAQADYVVRGVVTAINAEWRNDAHGQHIFTKVRFEVREVIKGTPPSPLVLEMLGGRIGKYQMVVQGTPNFIVGEESVLFVHGNGRQFFPLVAIMYGMYPITLDTEYFGGTDNNICT